MLEKSNCIQDQFKERRETPDSSKIIPIDRAREYREFSTSVFKASMSTRLKEVSEGSPLVVTHRGKPIALVNAIQGNSPSFGLSEKQAKEFHDLVGTLEAEDFPLLIHFVRKLIEVKVEGNAENEKQK